MRFRQEELNAVLSYIDRHATNGILRLDGYAGATEETGLRAGRIAALLYFLCGEGKILQDGNLILSLDTEPYTGDEEV